MAKYNVTLDSTGPLIIEDIGSWHGNNSLLIAGQPQDFYDDSISLTDTHGGRAYVQFNGTAIYLYGSQGPLYGEFSISIDGAVVYNGYSGQETPLSQQLLYSNTTLAMGFHNVTITDTWTNAARNLTDIDYYVWTTEIGSEGSVISQNNTIEWSNNTAWEFNGAWSQTGSSILYPPFANDASYTNTANANATLTFEGDAVTVYGATNVIMGPYEVSLDQADSTAYNGFHVQVNKEVIIYYADNLGPGVHVLTFINKPVGLGNENTLVIEKAIVMQATAPSAHHSHVGAVAGGTIGGLALVAFALAMFFWTRRGVHRTRTRIKPYFMRARDGYDQ